MDNQFVKGKPGYQHQSGGHFSWWPVRVYSGKPWPKEVPVLNETNFHAAGNGVGPWFPPGSNRLDPDKRSLGEWLQGFPYDDKVTTVYEAIRKAIKEITGRGIGGSYKMWMWEDKQDARTLAQVWNRAMENLGYTEQLGG
jgi:hypothetical protein